jgi:hypothetical protein
MDTILAPPASAPPAMARSRSDRRSRWPSGPARPFEVFAQVTSAADVHAAQLAGADGVEVAIDALVPADLGHDTPWALLELVHAAAELPVVVHGFSTDAEGELDPRLEAVVVAIVEADLAGMVRSVTVAFEDPGDLSAGGTTSAADHAARLREAADDLLGPDLALRLHVELRPGGRRGGNGHVTCRLRDIPRARKLVARPHV